MGNYNLATEVRWIAEELYNQANVAHPRAWQLRQTAEAYGNFTEYGNVVFYSTVRNRSAGLTVYLGGEAVHMRRMNERQRELVRRARETVSKVGAYVKKVPFVCVERTMGQNEEFAPHCRLFVSVQAREMVRIAYMWSTNLFPVERGKGPLLNIVYIPEWPETERQILVFPEQNTTFVLGSDYFGESKKGFLRMAMWCAKARGMLGLHAGTKIVRALNRDGRLKTYGMLLFGLSATGKTTHACHDHGLTGEGEGVEIVQDDVVFLKKDGSALGTEKGFYIKTEGLDADSQPLLFKAATCRDAIFENVMMNHLGRLDFEDETLTSNGRGIIQMANLAPWASESINLPSVEELDGLIVVFITRRNTVVPVVSKLTPEQAAASFMLGESVETSAGDPRRIGESVRVVGTNPFIVGDEAEEGNWFYEFLLRYPKKVECYLINTGGVGEIREKNEDGTTSVKREVTRIQIAETAANFRAIARHTIEWVREPYFGTLIPRKVEGVDISRFEPSSYYSEAELEAQVRQLKDERTEYLRGFAHLNTALVDAYQY